MDYGQLEELTDAEVVDRMRKCNYEKFKTLVRMHLSFELDLNTDEFDLPCHEIVYEDKGKFKKWSRLSKKHKHTVAITAAAAGCAVGSGNNSNGNSPVDTLLLQDHIDAGFIMHFAELKEFFLLEKNLTQEGIFRKTGSAARQNELRTQLKMDHKIDLESAAFSVHDCATVFKGCLADLPEPLLTDAHYPAYSQIANLCIAGAVTHQPTAAQLLLRQQTGTSSERVKREHQLLHSLQLLLLLLPDENRQLLMEIIEILHAVVDYQDFNKMTAQNLATLFTPHLVCPRNMPPEALHYLAKRMSTIIAFMIMHGMEIFEVPGKLATDIRAYFVERRRKTTMSPEQTLDDSISDISTVNTVYTFVDREKTAAAHSANTTDTELAQLYAHIQSMPESSKKRRLIKQFNKQNGQGTPLQFVVSNRLKQSETNRSVKSFSNSIKKHIFQKGLMSRTPKRAALSGGAGHPSTLRVLFQSPVLAAAPNNAGLTTPSAVTATAITYPTKGASSSSPHPKLAVVGSSPLLSALEAIAEPLPPWQDEASGHTNTNSNSNATPSQRPSRSTSHDMPDCFGTPQPPPPPPLTATLSNCSPPQRRAAAAGQAGSPPWQANFDSSASQSPPRRADDNPTLLTLATARYKSEPNLSCLAKEKLIDIPEAIDESHHTGHHTPICTQAARSKSLTHKLIKGVSMSNLRLPFTPESTKRLIRSVSSTLKLRAGLEYQQQQQQQHQQQQHHQHHHYHTPHSRLLYEMDEFGHTATQPLLLESTDEEEHNQSTSEEEEEAEAGQSSSSSPAESPPSGGAGIFEADTAALLFTAAGGAGSCHGLAAGRVLGGGLGVQHSAYHHRLLQHQNMNVLASTNTPSSSSTSSWLLGRRSMSPITKSTQRMSKAMQESIMTPRSRKPVMMLTTTALNSTEQNQKRSTTEQAVLKDDLDEEDDEEEKANALTSDFKEYLLSRSVLTASPVDSSFSSQPDDFGSTKEIADLDESQLSPSLLYCLDGNEPHCGREHNHGNVADDDHDNNDDGHNDDDGLLVSQMYQYGALNARKRAASTNLSEDGIAVAPQHGPPLHATTIGDRPYTHPDDEKENRAENVLASEFGASKKVMIVINQSGETSF